MQYWAIALWLELGYQAWIKRMGYKDARWNRATWRKHMAPNP